MNSYTYEYMYETIIHLPSTGSSAIYRATRQYKVTNNKRLSRDSGFCRATRDIAYLGGRRFVACPSRSSFK